MDGVSLLPLGRAIVRFRENVEAYSREPDNLFYLDSLIKRFEFTYELSRNTLQRFLEQTSTKLRLSEAPTMATLIRTANQDGLLRGTWEQWHGYRDARNQTSHAYDESKARDIAGMLPDFLIEVESLYERMRERLGEDAGAAP